MSLSRPATLRRWVDLALALGADNTTARHEKQCWNFRVYVFTDNRTAPFVICPLSKMGLNAVRYLQGCREESISKEAPRTRTPPTTIAGSRAVLLMYALTKEAMVAGLQDQERLES